jgi:hypothetical protein
MIEAIREELRRLKAEATARPSHRVLSRIAELEGMLAAYREEAAHETARQLIQDLMNKD